MAITLSETLSRQRSNSFSDLGDFNARFVEALPEGLTAGRGEKLWRNQCAPDLETRA